MVQVRNIHKNSRQVFTAYKKYFQNHYEFAVELMNEYSMIFSDIGLTLSNECTHKRLFPEKK